MSSGRGVNDPKEFGFVELIEKKRSQVKMS